MKNIKKIIILMLIFAFYSCATSNFVLTGNEYPALGENAIVKVNLENKTPDGFEEIGVIEIECSSPPPPLNEVVDLAKQKAREKGGNCIILISEEIVTSAYLTRHGGGVNQAPKYRFKVGRIKG